MCYAAQHPGDIARTGWRRPSDCTGTYVFTVRPADKNICAEGSGVAGFEHAGGVSGHRKGLLHPDPVAGILTAAASSAAGLASREAEA